MKLNILLFLEDSFPFDQIPIDEEFYQFVILRRKDIPVQNSYEFISGIQRTSKSILWISIGDWDDVILQFSEEYTKRWMKRQDFTNWSSDQVSQHFFEQSILSIKEKPLISVFTTTFHSGSKILRPLDSLKTQTYKNWEWIIWDDSKDGKTFEALQEIEKKDIRIQVFKAPAHSGYIGEMKRRSCGLCRGKYVVELDHDDRISPDLFEIVYAIDQKYPYTDFIYSDYAMIKEESGKDATYGSTFGYGYGSYMNQWSSDGISERYYISAINPAINPSTVRYIIGMPNHVRVWNRCFYNDILEHNPNLPVVDDYELLIRTFINSENWVRIPSPKYFQYQNEGGDNFTNHRNALIQHLTKWSSKMYEPQISQRFMNLFGRDNKIYFKYTWREYQAFEYPHFGKIYDVNEKDLTIIIPACLNSATLRKTLESIFLQDCPNWKIYIIGNNCPELQSTIEWIIQKYPSLTNRIDWWNEFEETQTEADLINYALKLYVTNFNWDKDVLFLKAGMMCSQGFISRYLKFRTENSVDEKISTDIGKENDMYGTIFKMSCFKDSLLVSC